MPAAPLTAGGDAGMAMLVTHLSAATRTAAACETDTDARREPARARRAVRGLQAPAGCHVPEQHAEHEHDHVAHGIDRLIAALPNIMEYSNDANTTNMPVR